MVPMKTCAEIRLENLERLILETGTIETLAELCDVSSGYLSQIRTRQPDSKSKRPRGMGDELARQIERGMGKEVGWMDHDHQPGDEVGEKAVLVAPLDADTTRMLRAWERMPVNLRKHFTALLTQLPLPATEYTKDLPDREQKRKHA